MVVLLKSHTLDNSVIAHRTLTHRFERAAPVRTLVQKQSGGLFLARGRIHGLADAPGTGVDASPLFVAAGFHTLKTSSGSTVTTP